MEVQETREQAAAQDIPWLEDNPRYRCCCGMLHVKRAAIVIGIVELALMFGYLIDAIRSFASKGALAQSVVEVFYAVIFIIVVLIMMYGVRMEKKTFLVPHIVWSLICIVLSVLLAALLILGFMLASKLTLLASTYL